MPLLAAVRGLKRLNTAPYHPSPAEFLSSMAIERFLKGKKRILIVGDNIGREYRVLQARGKDLYVLDIAPQNNVPRFYHQSITERTPFQDGFFDGIVLAEVIEHLFEDTVALNEIHRILKDDGVLAVTVPYISRNQDAPEYHVRVHTQNTMQRLLAYCGFDVEEHFYRGAIGRMATKNGVTRLLFRGPQLALALFGGKRGLRAYRNACYALETGLGRGEGSRWLLSMSEGFGGFIKARKGSKRDFDRLQVEAFSDNWTE